MKLFDNIKSAYLLQSALAPETELTNWWKKVNKMLKIMKTMVMVI